MIDRVHVFVLARAKASCAFGIPVRELVLPNLAFGIGLNEK
jgi:hypothetical protein